MHQKLRLVFWPFRSRSKQCAIMPRMPKVPELQNFTTTDVAILTCYLICVWYHCKNKSLRNICVYSDMEHKMAEVWMLIKNISCGISSTIKSHEFNIQFWRHQISTSLRFSSHSLSPIIDPGHLFDPHTFDSNSLVLE
jgi:hypothetical protein